MEQSNHISIAVQSYNMLSGFKTRAVAQYAELYY